MPVLEGFDFVKEEVPLKFKQGQTILILVQITDDLGVASDITGRSYEAVIVDSTDTPILTITGVITDGPNGLVQFLSGSTLALTVGQYYWEVWENSDNYLWGGSVEITKRRSS